MRASAPMRSLGSSNVRIQKACSASLPRLTPAGRACVVGRPSMQGFRISALGRDDGLNVPKNEIADQLLSEAAKNRVAGSSGLSGGVGGFGPGAGAGGIRSSGLGRDDGLNVPKNNIADQLLSEAAKGKPSIIVTSGAGTSGVSGTGGGAGGGLGSQNVGVGADKIGNTGSAAENVKGLKAVRGVDGSPVLETAGGGGGGSGGNWNRGGGGGGGGGGQQPSGGSPQPGTPGWAKALLGAAVISCGVFVVTTGMESMKGVQKSDVKGAKEVEAKKTEKAAKDAGSKAHSKVDDAGHKVKDTVDNLLHKGEHLVHRGEDNAKHAADELKQKQAEHEAKQKAEEAKQAAKQKAEEAKQNTKHAADEAKHGAKHAGEEIRHGAKNAADEVKSKVDKAAGVVKGKLGEIDADQVRATAGRTAQYLAYGTGALLGAAALAASVVEGSKEVAEFKRRHPQKARQLEGQAKDAARDVKGQAQGLAKDLKGRAQGTAEDVKSRAQGAAEDVKRDTKQPTTTSAPQTTITGQQAPSRPTTTTIIQQAPQKPQTTTTTVQPTSSAPKTSATQSSSGNQGSLAPHADPKAERDARKGVNDISGGRADNRMEPAPANAYSGVGAN